MISAQVDKLRELALWLDDEFYDVEAAKVRDAADTIWELRDDLQRANVENARLRSELDSVGTAAYLYGRSDLKAENAKLRELVLDYFNAPCLECNPWAEGWEGCNHCESGNCTLATRTLELGIEVDA